MLHVPEQGVVCSQLLLLNLAVQLQETCNHGIDPDKIKDQRKIKITLVDFFAL